MPGVPIILIGPMKAGKSTVGRILAAKLNLPRVSLDDIRYSYYNEKGFDMSYQQELMRNNKFEELYRYWKPYEAHAVERVLQEYHQCVIDFGAGHSVYEDSQQLEKVKKMLSPYPNVILLMPSPDMNESLEILNKRTQLDLNQHFVTHPSNYSLAKYIIYTKGRTPDETADDIINCISVS